MSFAERALSQPGVLISGCLVWIPLAVWVVAMVQWWVAGEVEAPYAAVSILVALGLGLVTVRPPTPWLSPVLLLVVVLTCVLYIPLRKMVNDHSMLGIDVETLRRSLNELQMRPDNVAARLRAGDVLFRLGRRGHAVALCQDAVEGLNPAVFRQEIQTVKMWRAQTPDSELVPSPCLRCGAQNQAGSILCVQCQGDFLLDSVRGTRFAGDLAQRLVASWIAGALVLGGIPLVFAYGAGSPLFTVLGLVAVAGLAVLVCTRGGVFQR